MKRPTTLLVATLSILSGCQITEKSTTDADFVYEGIRWTGNNETANYLALAGLRHYMNIEPGKAYNMSDHAVKLDSSLFASHALLALNTTGAKREYHKEMAEKYVQNENETSKLFVSLLDVDDSTNREQRAIWSKMHKLSNGPFIHYMYLRNNYLQEDADVTLEGLDSLISFCLKNGLRINAAAAYNIKGYVLNDVGDLELGTEAIEKYRELYPEGHNPIDSRAEFYLFAGDTATAIAWYRKVLEQYPYYEPARVHLEELGADTN